MRILKSIGKWVVESIRETLNQIFTLVGLFLAWLALSGEAQIVAGWILLWGTVIWILTIAFRLKE
jgi:hypothetical protein